MKMKCFVCKREFDENDLFGVEITPQDENGNDTGETKKIIVCDECVFKLLGFDPEEMNDDEM